MHVNQLSRILSFFINELSNFNNLRGCLLHCSKNEHTTVSSLDANIGDICGYKPTVIQNHTDIHIALHTKCMYSAGGITIHYFIFILLHLSLELDAKQQGYDNTCC